MRMKLHNRSRLTDLENRTYSWGARTEEGRDSQGVWGGPVLTNTLKTDNQQRPTAQPRDLERKGSLEENGYMYMYGWDSPETIIILLTLCIPIQD